MPGSSSVVRPSLELAVVAPLLSVAALICAPPAPAAAQGGPVLVVGDSLEVGTGPALRRQLPMVEVDALTNRPSSEGVGILRARLRAKHEIVVFDLGTNDDPSQPGGLAQNLAAARELVGERCLVVSTLVRPPLNGVSVAGLNRVVARFADSDPKVRVADWRAVALASPELMRPDGVHPTPEGYSRRAAVVAEAIQSCSATSAEPSPPPPRDSAPDPPRAPRALAEPPGLDWRRLLARLPLGGLASFGQAVARQITVGARAVDDALSPPRQEPRLGGEADPLGKRSP